MQEKIDNGVHILDPAPPRPVSEEFIQLLINQGASSRLIYSIRKQNYEEFGVRPPISKLKAKALGRYAQGEITIKQLDKEFKQILSYNKFGNNYDYIICFIIFTLTFILTCVGVLIIFL